jgi:hypothetical protein
MASFLSDKPRCLNDLSATFVSISNAEESPAVVVFEIGALESGALSKSVRML